LPVADNKQSGKGHTAFCLIFKTRQKKRRREEKKVRYNPPRSSASPSLRTPKATRSLPTPTRFLLFHSATLNYSGSL
jgi:hypothetical protein